MEIIHVILGKANPQRMNGVNRVVYEMASNQVRLGYDVEVCGITAGLTHDYPARTFSTKLFQAYRNPFSISSPLKKYLAEKKGKAVVHFHGAFIPRFYAVAKLLHRFSIPYIITPHSTYNLFMMKKNALLKKIYFTLFEKKLLDGAAYVHLLGQSEWEGLEHIYHNKKSVLFPYGFSAPTDEALNVPKPARFTVGFCGRLAIYPKGLDILINGFALFLKTHPPATLIIIGDGKERAQLQKLCRDAGVQESVVFTGSLYGEEKIAMLNRCHVFAHPSRTDGLPATIVEAASLALPCIVSAETNMGDYVQQYDAGDLMTNTSAESFSESLATLHRRINAGEFPILQQNSLAMIRGVFDWTLVLAKFNTIYKRAMGTEKQVLTFEISRNLVINR